MEEELFEDNEIFISNQSDETEEDEFFDIDHFMEDLKQSGLNASSFLEEREGEYQLVSKPVKKNLVAVETIILTIDDINSKKKYEQLSLF